MPNTARPDISLIIVSYNVRGFLEAMLDSLRRGLGGLTAETFVVDNRSSDNSQDMVRTQFPEITLIENPNNVGFAAANNRALSLCRGRYVCLVNPDVLLQEDTLETMVAFMDAHPDVGASGCKVLNPDGRLQLACRRSIPTPVSAFFKLTGLSRLFPNNRIIGAYNLTYLDSDVTSDVDAVSGSFIVARRETLEAVGPMDEAFFMYGEDLDWMYRIRQAGWRVCYVPGTRIIHYKGESARKSRSRSAIEFYRAMYLFARKHRPATGLSVLSGMVHGLVTAGIVAKGAMALSVGLVQRCLILLLDLAIINSAALLAPLIWLDRLTPLTLSTVDGYLFVHLLDSVVCLGCLYGAGSFGIRRFSAARAAIAVTVAFVILSAITNFATAYRFSRVSILLTWVIGVALIAGWRMVAANLVVARKRTIIVGTDYSALAVFDQLSISPHSDCDIVGFIDSDDEIIGSAVRGFTVLNGNGQLSVTLDHNRVDEVIVASSQTSYKKILHLVSSCTRLGIGLKLVSQHSAPTEKPTGELLEMVTLVEVGGDPVASAGRTLRRLMKKIRSHTV